MWEKERDLGVEQQFSDGSLMVCRANIGDNGVQKLLSQLTELTTSL